MDLLISFVVFMGAMLWCITCGHTMIIALFIGLIGFIIVGKRRGFKPGELCDMGVTGFKDALIVIEVMFTIGLITAVWRASGTIAFFVYFGIRLITPNLFLIITFALCCLLSYALGTSFGVAATVGVIFMALARTGGVSEILTGAAVMSGIYFGDRGSPVSSSAILVAAITRTDILNNVKLMMRTGMVPLAITTVLYGIFSFLNPINAVDQHFLTVLADKFSISWWCVIPAICMLVLPLLKVKVIYAMAASIFTGSIVSIFVQKIPLGQLFDYMVFGYQIDGELGVIMNGGGAVSMIEVVVIVALSSTYSGIFSGTGMLMGLQSKMMPMMKKIGRFATMVVVSLVTVAVFCNQTIASMMCCDLLKRPYEELGAQKEELAMDMENSVILLSAVVPWVLACSVVLDFLQVGYSIVPLSFFLFLTPICYGIQKKVANPFSKE